MLKCEVTTSVLMPIYWRFHKDKKTAILHTCPPLNSIVFTCWHAKLLGVLVQRSLHSLDKLKLTTFCCTPQEVWLDPPRAGACNYWSLRPWFSLEENHHQTLYSVELKYYIQLRISSSIVLNDSTYIHSYGMYRARDRHIWSITVLYVNVIWHLMGS